MRLICPNCGAQYEVAEDTIPETGRDVQCSNCGHTWLERPGASEAGEYPEAAEVPAAPDTSDNVAWDDEEDEQEDLTPAPRPPANRPALDASVAEILREEAEREAASRRRPAAPMESQTDLGLSDPPAKTTQEQDNIAAARRIASMKGEDIAGASKSAAAAATAAAAVQDAATRKEVLPDIEEINSTLRSSADRGDDIDLTPDEIVQTKRRSFRFGFFGVLLIIALLVLVYIFATPIKDAVPSVAGPIDSYVAMVDDARLWLDLKVQGLTASMEADAPTE